MRTTITYRASLPVLRFGPWRAPLGAAAVVLLLSLLFAGAIVAALQPHPPVDARLAAVQGGL